MVEGLQADCLKYSASLLTTLVSDPGLLIDFEATSNLEVDCVAPISCI